MMQNIDDAFDFTVIERFDEPAIFTDETLKVLYQNKAAENTYGSIVRDSVVHCYEHLKGIKQKCPKLIEHVQQCSADLLISGEQKQHYTIHEHRTESGLKYFLMEKFYNRHRGLLLQIHTDVTDIVSNHLSNSLLNKADVESMCFETFGANIRSIKTLVGFNN